MPKHIYNNVTINEVYGNNSIAEAPEGATINFYDSDEDSDSELQKDQIFNEAQRFAKEMCDYAQRQKEEALALAKNSQNNKKIFVNGNVYQNSHHHVTFKPCSVAKNEGVVNRCQHFEDYRSYKK